MFRLTTIVLLGALSALSAGCINMSSPAKLAPGAGPDAIRQQLGEPTGRYALADGAQRLEYARGPYGRETWMLDVDAQGRLVKASQVLVESNFATIKAGMTRDEVLQRIGRPSKLGYVGWQKQTVWNYRYASPFCQWFQVGLSQAGIVEDTGYGPDPVCDDIDTPLGAGVMRLR